VNKPRIHTPRFRIRAAVLGLAALVLGVAATAGAIPFSSSSDTATVFVSVAPQRVLDTRGGIGAPMGKMSSSLTFSLAASVPEGARAVVLTLTAADGTADSYLSAQPSGSVASYVSSVNFPAGRAVANQVTVLLGTNQGIRVTNAFGEVNVIADLSGYFIDLPDNGTPGPTGDQGLPGANGATGAPGIRGATGVTGATGATGTTGTTGTTGATGVSTTGATGSTGAPGASGPASFAYIYNLAAQTVAVEGDIPFDTNGSLVGGIAHSPGTAQILVPSAGDYLVNFSVSGTEPNEFALTLNNTVVPSTRYGSGGPTQQTNGQAILSLAAGDVLTLRNNTSASSVTLQTLAGGTATNVNASIVLQKFS
jgi:hypothetical protein